jgi:hypothetical protein
MLWSRGETIKITELHLLLETVVVTSCFSLVVERYFKKATVIAELSLDRVWYAPFVISR